jgi:hypothetical protein
MMNYSTTNDRAQLSRWVRFALLAAAVSYAGCSKAPTAETESTMHLKQEPAGAVDVLALRKDAKDQDDVVVVGRIGGRQDPWIKGTAAFPIVDRSLRPCNEIPGDACPTPWDYCCEADLPDATVLVTFVDASGRVIKEDPRELLNVKELQTVVVQGKAKRDEAGNVTVLASKIHVRDNEKAKE